LKRKVKKLFLKGLLQSFFIVIILFGAGWLGYQATMNYLKIPEDDIVTEVKLTPTPKPITTASVDEISKNLIYCYNKKTKEINKIVLEIYHCQKKQLTYITIPVNTKMTMSDSLYRRLVLAHPDIPQIIKLSSITKYFDKDTVFDYGVLLAEDLLNLQLSYYTVIPQDVYEQIFVEQYTTVLSDEISNETTTAANQEKIVPVEKFTEEYVEFLKSLTTKEELSTYIEDIYSSFKSNLSVYDKMNYLDSYCKTPFSNISFVCIPGEDYNSGFEIDEYEVTKQLQALITDDNGDQSQE